VTTTTVAPEEIARRQKDQELNAAFSKLPDDFTDSFHKELQEEKVKTTNELTVADARGHAETTKDERERRRVEAAEAVASISQPAQSSRQDSTMGVMSASQYIHTLGQDSHTQTAAEQVAPAENSQVPLPETLDVATPVTDSAPPKVEGPAPLAASNMPGPPKPAPAATAPIQSSINPYTGEAEASKSATTAAQGSENPYIHFLKLVQLHNTPEKRTPARKHILKIPLRRIMA
jgi:hypothetical protein